MHPCTKAHTSPRLQSLSIAHLSGVTSKHPPFLYPRYPHVLTTFFEINKNSSDISARPYYLLPKFTQSSCTELCFIFKYLYPPHDEHLHTPTSPSHPHPSFLTPAQPHCDSQALPQSQNPATGINSLLHNPDYHVLHNFPKYIPHTPHIRTTSFLSHPLPL